MRKAKSTRTTFQARIPRRTDMLGENAKWTKNVVSHDISTSKPTELDAEEFQERPMSFHMTFSKKPTRVGRLSHGNSINTIPSAKQFISFSPFLIFLGFSRSLSRRSSTPHDICFLISISISLHCDDFNYCSFLFQFRIQFCFQLQFRSSVLISVIVVCSDYNYNCNLILKI